VKTETSIELGAPVDCDDGLAGKLRGIAVDAESGTVVHMIVDPPRRRARARLVSVDLVAPVARGDWGLLLTCTQAEFDAQPSAVEVALRPGGEDRTADPTGWVRVGDTLMYSKRLLPGPAAATDIDVMPDGEVELGTGATVVDCDYESVGRLRALVVDPEWRITAVESERHHVPGSSSVKIPIEEVVTIEQDLVRLELRLAPAP
jgi:sporulation protein YlmC with PRC-barrel domain